MASNVVSMWRSRASWLTHADTSVTAGRRSRGISSVSACVIASDGRRRADLDRVEEVVDERLLQRSLVEPAHPAQTGEIGRRALRDPEDREVGQHEAHRLIERGGAPLTPRGDLLRDASARPPEVTMVFDKVTLPGRRRRLHDRRPQSRRPPHDRGEARRYVVSAACPASLMVTIIRLARSRSWSDCSDPPPVLGRAR